MTGTDEGRKTLVRVGRSGKPLVNHADAAAYLGLSPKTLYNYTQEKADPRIPRTKVGNDNWYDPDDLDAFDQARTRVIEGVGIAADA